MTRHGRRRHRTAAALALAVALAALSASPAGADRARGPGTSALDVRLSAQLATAGPQDLVSVVVVLTRQTDLGSVTGTGRSRRRAAVLRALHATATAGQQALLTELGRLRSLGEVTKVTPLWVIDAVQVTATPAAIASLAARADVTSVQPDAVSVAPTSAVPAAQVAAQVMATANEPAIDRLDIPALWDRGLRGEGMVVANMDTGVDVTHPELAGRWRGGAHSWFDPNGEHPTTPTDVNGHGTWTMGAMVGGAAGGSAIGAAPGATWIAVKIFNDRGQATSTGIHLGFQWLLDPDGDVTTDDAPDVVDDSWTASSTACDLDFQPDLRGLRAAGILPVFAAGNDGPAPGTVASPANLPEAFSVGAVDGSDTVDTSSSRGPSSCSGASSPQAVAPGVDILTTDLYGLYVRESGTSMAAPLVVGTLALLLQGFPGLAVERQQAALQSAATDLGAPGPDTDYGAGRVDALAAYQWLAAAPDFTVAVTPGTATIPPGGTVDFQLTVLATNGFTGDVDLTVTGLEAAPATGSIDPPVVRGGAGTAALTVAASATAADGSYPLTVTATSGATSRTAQVTLLIAPPPDFALTAAPDLLVLRRGAAMSSVVTVSESQSFAGPVDLTTSGLPAGVGTATLTPSSLAGSGTAQLTVTARVGAPAGSYPVTVTGTSGGLRHSTSVTVRVPALWTIAVLPTSAVVARGSTARFAVLLIRVGQTPGPVTLSVTGLPSGATASFGANPVTPTGRTWLDVGTTAATRQGRVLLTVWGWDGVRLHRAPTVLTVR